MKKILEIGLGIIVALGTFVDIGELVFATQSGAKFGYQLIWAVVLGVIGAMVYTEMSGRVAAVTKRAVFDIIRTDYSPRFGWFALIGSLFLNVLTCAAEIGGVALALQILSDLPYELLIVVAVLALILIVWFLPFKGIERLFGYAGLGLLAIVIAAIKLHPDWGGAAHGLLPHITSGGNPWSYLYFAVGLMAAMLMPYEVYFYSSGGIEEKWKPDKDMVVNRGNTIIGYILGGVVVVGIIGMAAELLRPAGINPQFIGTPMLGALVTLGKTGLVIAIIGAMFAIAGSAVETAFSGAYNLSQFLGWPWGKHLDQLKVPRFTISWIVIFLLAATIILTGIDPIFVTEYAVIFSVVMMPLTFWPIFKVSGDRARMGKYTNKWLANTLGWVFFVIICIISLAAIPLMIYTNRGQL
jgi:manganese transport protein